MSQENSGVDPDQLVFGFLKEDPDYRVGLLREEIAREVTRRVSEEVVERLPEMISSAFYDTVRKTIEGSVDRATGRLAREIRAVRAEVRREYEDPADWWKRGGTEDADNDLPF